MMNEESLKNWEQENIELLTSREMGEWLRRRDMNARPQGECEKCDYRKFAERFVDGIVDFMNKNDITSFEQLSEILKGGAE